jgi:hypothetical protein
LFRYQEAPALCIGGGHTGGMIPLNVGVSSSGELSIIDQEISGLKIFNSSREGP